MDAVLNKQLWICSGKGFPCKCHLTALIHPWISTAVTIHIDGNNLCLSGVDVPGMSLYEQRDEQGWETLNLNKWYASCGLKKANFWRCNFSLWWPIMTQWVVKNKSSIIAAITEVKGPIAMWEPCWIC